MNIWIWRFYFGVRFRPNGSALIRFTVGYCKGDDPRDGYYIHIGNMDGGWILTE